MRFLSAAVAITTLGLSTVRAQDTSSSEPSCEQDTGGLPRSEFSKIVFARVSIRTLCALSRDSVVRRATGAHDAFSLLGSVYQDVLWRTSDEDLVAFFAAFGESLSFVDAATCATMYPHSGGAPWAQTFMSVATAIDSAMAVRWTRFIEAWVWARVKDAPLLPSASRAEVYSYAQRQLRTITPGERADMIKLARGETLPPQRACHVVRLSFARLAAGHPAQAGPVIRTLMSGLVPWFSADT